MPLTFTLDQEFLRYRASGDVDFDEGLGVLQEGLAAAAAADEGAPWPVLFDIRESAERRRADELRGIANVLGEHRGAVADYCAIVVASPLYYGLSRMFAHYGEGSGIWMEVFDDLADAEAWLRAPTQAE